MSKSFIAISLLAILISACNQPVHVTTLPAEMPQFAQPMPSPTPTALFQTTNSTAETPTPLIVTATKAVRSLPTVSFDNMTDNVTPVRISTVSVSCPAPAPHVVISQQVTVMVEDWDKLKLRSRAALSEDTLVMELNQYTQLKILDGPVCVRDTATEDAFLFWKVAVIPSGEVGWVAEGDIWHYFIQ